MMHNYNKKEIQKYSQRYNYGKATYIPAYQISRMTIGTIAANSRYIDIVTVSGYCFFTVFSRRKSSLRSNLISQILL